MASRMTRLGLAVAVFGGRERARPAPTASATKQRHGRRGLQFEPERQAPQAVRAAAARQQSVVGTPLDTDGQQPMSAAENSCFVLGHLGEHELTRIIIKDSNNDSKKR